MCCGDAGGRCVRAGNVDRVASLCDIRAGGAGGIRGAGAGVAAASGGESQHRDQNQTAEQRPGFRDFLNPKQSSPAKATAPIGIVFRNGELF